VFSAEHWNRLFGELIAKGPSVVGISSAQKRNCFLPSSFTSLHRTPRASVLGGRAGYQLRVWKSK
jgi:hypothetical protein